MMYTTDSLLTPFTGTHPAWDGVLAGKQAVGPSWAIVGSYQYWCQQYGIDANLALAQACLESAFFTSDRWKNEWNPAGLGITADDTPPRPFATYDEGIRAHIEHLCCYVYTADRCPCDHAALADRRHTFHDGLPRVADLIRPNRKWAVPGTTYAAHIVQIANEVTGGTVTPVPYDRVHISADLGPQRTLDSIQWVVIHDTEGSFFGDEGVLTSPAAPVESANLLIGRVPGQCVLIVPLDTTAWTAGNDAVSVAAMQIELSRNPANGETDYTAYQYEKAAECIRSARDQGMVNVPFVYIGRVDGDGGPLPDKPGLIGHSDVPDPDHPGQWGGVAHHTDPGPTFDWNRLIALIGHTAPPPGLPEDARMFPETGWRIIGGFKAHWEANDGMAAYGFPITDERTEHGITVQYFERARFELHGDTVLLGRVGSELLGLRGEHGPGIDQ
jgi:N-acetyl-anhydromuramyl-L-alanine amidase AmpD